MQVRFPISAGSALADFFADSDDARRTTTRLKIQARDNFPLTKDNC
jgi:hypothetical protein